MQQDASLRRRKRTKIERWSKRHSSDEKRKRRRLKGRDGSLRPRNPTEQGSRSPAVKAVTAIRVNGAQRNKARSSGRKATMTVDPRMLQLYQYLAVNLECRRRPCGSRREGRKRHKVLGHDFRLGYRRGCLVAVARAEEDTFAWVRRY